MLCKGAGIFALLSIFVSRSTAQPYTFAGDAQHTGVYSTPAQHLNAVRWSTQLDPSSGSTLHFGAPVISPSNTVFVPIRTNNRVQIRAFEGATGRLKYSLTSDYIFPASSWLPVCQPVISMPASGPRLYYPGAGGTTYYITNIDSDTPSQPVHECFYTDLATYGTNTNGFNSTVYISTPLTAGPQGIIFFQFRISGVVPAPFSATNSGVARLDSNGQATYIFDGPAASDSRVTTGPLNCAPALSNDGSTVYVVVLGGNITYLLGLDSSSLATKYQVALRDPRNTNNVSVSDMSTASPMVGPDGDVFFGVLDSSNRGFLLHFSGDLQTQKTPGGFGWDNTAAIVPTNMVPSYSGTSSYLLFSKYNDYGNRIHRIAVLDPNAQQIDPHPSALGLREMREVLTAIGCTPDSSSGATVREWCVNTAAVNPPTSSVFCPNEDGRLYRWDLRANSFTENLRLGNPVGDPYVPTVIGLDGTIFALNGNKLFAVISFTNVAVALYSSAPDMSSVLLGQPVTFTAVITNLDVTAPVPIGTVTFQDLTYKFLTPITNIMATNVPLVNGTASVTNSTLTASTNLLGNHFITAFYSGDTNFAPANVTLVQKVHASGTVTIVNSSVPDANNAVRLSAVVTPITAGFGKPTGQVTFWDGTNFLAQVPLNTNSITSFVVTNAIGTGHVIAASYASDTFFASSSGPLVPTQAYLTGLTILSNGAFQFVFTNLSGAPFSVLGATDIGLPLSNWSLLGTASEVSPWQFQFQDTDATNNSQRFYRVRSP